MYWPTYGRMPWDPFSELRTLQREMNRLFEGASGATPGRSGVPALNLWSNGEQAVVTMEMPGIDPKDIDISVLRDDLTVTGERKAEEPAEGVVCHRMEREAGRFVRTVRLPFEVENSKVSASYDKGILTITMPRAEATKPKRIAIQSA